MSVSTQNHSLVLIVNYPSNLNLGHRVRGTVTPSGVGPEYFDNFPALIRRLPKVGKYGTPSATSFLPNLILCLPVGSIVKPNFVSALPPKVRQNILIQDWSHYNKPEGLCLCS